MCELTKADNTHKTHTDSNQMKVSSLRTEIGQKILPLPKTLFAIDTCWRKENQCSPMEHD